MESVCEVIKTFKGFLSFLIWKLINQNVLKLALRKKLLKGTLWYRWLHINTKILFDYFVQ